MDMGNLVEDMVVVGFVLIARNSVVGIVDGVVKRP